MVTLVRIIYLTQGVAQWDYLTMLILPHWAKPTLRAAIPIACLVVCVFLHPQIMHLVGKQTDSALVIILYIIGAAPVLVGGWISIMPPKTTKGRIASLIVFAFALYAGFHVISEQATRAELTTQEVTKATREDAKNKQQYDSDVRDLKNQFVGMKNAIAEVAKGSANPNWTPLLSRMDGMIASRPLIAPANYGNLKARANELADEIMKNICQDGWGSRCPSGLVVMERIPQTSKEEQMWVKFHSNMFRGKFLPRLIELRDDFAKLNFKDQELDQAIANEIQLIQASAQTKAKAAADGHPISYSYVWDILPQQMEEIAQRLRALGNLADSTGAPGQIRLHQP